MSADIVVAGTDVTLHPAPINPDWILDGAPVATAGVLARCKDGSANTVVWNCTAGSFEWIYDADETVHVLEGSVVLTDRAGTRRVGPGDVIFFPAGSKATWQVDDYIKKLALFHMPLPAPVALMLGAWNALHLSGIVRRIGVLARRGAPRRSAQHRLSPV